MFLNRVKKRFLIHKLICFFLLIHLEANAKTLTINHKKIQDRSKEPAVIRRYGDLLEKHPKFQKKKIDFKKSTTEEPQKRIGGGIYFAAGGAISPVPASNPILPGLEVGLGLMLNFYLKNNIYFGLCVTEWIFFGKNFFSALLKETGNLPDHNNDSFSISGTQTTIAIRFGKRFAISRTLNIVPAISLGAPLLKIETSLSDAIKSGITVGGTFSLQHRSKPMGVIFYVGLITYFSTEKNTREHDVDVMPECSIAFFVGF